MYNKIKEILKDVRLLIVEDDDELRVTLRDSVEKYVKQIFECSNAKDALVCFKQNDINLILSDINMPRMSGLEMASLIRQDDKNVPIIFLTDCDSDENVFEAIELGGFGVLKKPFEKRELVIMMSFATNKFKSDFASVNLKNGFSFNAFSRELFKDGASIALTKKEQNLLHLLLKNNGKTVSFEMIESYVWQESCTPETIRSFVYKLRKKIYPEPTKNAQGMGYRLNLSQENLRTVNKITYV